ncbi:MAG: lipocalin-like domain-containing protein [Pseudomonadales bacterium]
MNPDSLIGAWRLKSSTVSKNGISSPSFGDPPAGQLQYTADGRMAAFLMNPRWAKDGVNAKSEHELFFSYAGSWELNDYKVQHTIEFSSVPGRIGTVFVRTINVVSDDEIELLTEPETTASNNVYVSTLVWRRHAGA